MPVSTGRSELEDVQHTIDFQLNLEGQAFSETTGVTARDVREHGTIIMSRRNYSRSENSWDLSGTAVPLGFSGK
jgi:hypothetical protein